MCLAMFLASRPASRDGHHREILNLALQDTEPRIGPYDLMGERTVRVCERVHRVDHHFLRNAADFGNAPPIFGLSSQRLQRELRHRGVIADEGSYSAELVASVIETVAFF